MLRNFDDIFGRVGCDCFNGHFPGGPGLAGIILDFIGAKGDEVVVITGAIRREVFYRLDAFLSQQCQSTEGQGAMCD